MSQGAPIPFASGRGPLQAGDAFVFLDLPPGAHVGCDTLVGTTDQTTAQPTPDHSAAARPDATSSSPSYCGFRDIPPGAHFAWISAPGAMSRQGCWFVTSQTRSGGAGGAGGAGTAGAAPGTVHIKKWHRFHEVLVDFQYPDQGAPSAAEDLSAALAQLIPYGAGSSSSPKAPPVTVLPGFGRHGGIENDIELWRQLTSCVTEPVLDRIAGVPIPATPPREPREWLFATTDTAKDEAAMPGERLRQDAGSGSVAAQAEFSFLFAKDGLDAYRLLALHEKKNKHQAGPDDNDTTERLLVLVEHPQSRIAEVDIVGELQFAFVTGIVLSNLSCLEQWWHFVLRIFLRARHLVARRPTLCRALLQSLLAQLTYLERFTSAKIPRLSTWGSAASEGAGDGGGGGAGGNDGNDGGTGLFDAKPQGAVRLRASLAVFRRQFKFSNNDSKTDKHDARVDEKSILSTSMAEASAAEAFMDLEALLWRYGWDLSGRTLDDDGDNESGQVAGGRNNRHRRNGGDEDDDEDEIEIYDTPLKEGAQVGTRHAKVHSALSDSDDDDDDDDYQPVVVDMDEHGNEVGLVSWD